MIYDYIVIGAGISGVTAARLLQLAGIDRVCVLEAAPVPGGLCRTKIIDGHILDTGGGHFLCTKYPEVYRFIFDHIAKDRFNYFDRISHIAIEGHEIDYPLETNIWQLPERECADYLASIARNGEARGLPPPTHFEAWSRWKLGDRITDRYMLPYNRKIWGVEAAEMDIDWLHKIPRLDVEHITRACRTRSADPTQLPSHAGFYYPKQGGFQGIFDAIVAPVSDRIVTNCPVTSIEKQGSHLVVNGCYRAKAIINTAPWHRLSDSPIFDATARAAIAQLRHNQLVVSLHQERYATKAHWLYQPDEQLPHHRSFFINNFAPHSAPDGFYRETNLKRWRAGGGELYAETNSHAYPIPTLGWANAIDSVLRHCAPLGVHGLGRWGQWQYFNSDVCIREAMQLLARLTKPVAAAA